MREDLMRDSDELDAEMAKYKQEAEDMESEKKDMGEEMTEEEILAAEEERKSNLVGHEEFKILTSRVDVMDQSIGKIVGRIESVLSQLELIERQKLKRRENMTNILEKLNEAQDTNSELKRSQLQKMVKDELENWDDPISPSRMDSAEFEERASSARVLTASTGITKKQPWFQN